VAIYKADIQANHDYWFGLNAEMQNSECTEANGTVTCKMVIQHDCASAAGMDGLHYPSIEYVFENHLIQKVTSWIMEEDLFAMNGFIVSVNGWSAVERSEEVRQMSDSGISNREAGKIMVKLCQEYAATKP
jgi:predicted phosphohydrolase